MENYTDVDIKTIPIIEKYNKGRKKICIDVSLEEFNANPIYYIKENITTCIGLHNRNVGEIKYLKAFRKGIQDILKKTKVDGSSINNIEVTNYAQEIIEFKKGFYVGNPITYINSTEEKNDSMSYFQKVMKDSKKSSKDLEKYDNILTFGIAHTFVIPTKKKIDVTKKSPFEYIVLDSEKTFVVYSNDIFKDVLFSCVISTTKVNNVNCTTYTCYYDSKCSIFTYENGDYTNQTKAMPIEQPITEYELNANRMGVFEPILSSLNTCNFIRSNQLDDIQQFVNAYLVFLNADPKYVLANAEAYKKARMLAVKSNNPSCSADVKILQQSLNHGDINNMYNDMKQDLFNIVGVPMATSSTGQGVSGEAQTYGGGWENAQTMAKVDTQYISRFEREDLDKICYICEEYGKGNFVDTNSIDIDIKYTINKSNNIMVKAQSFKYLVDLGVTYEDAFELTQLSDDSHQLGVRTENHYWEKIEKQNEIDMQKQEQQKELNAKYTTQSQNANDNKETNQDDNSK